MDKSYIRIANFIRIFYVFTTNQSVSEKDLGKADGCKSRDQIVARSNEVRSDLPSFIHLSYHFLCGLQMVKIFVKQ